MHMLGICASFGIYQPDPRARLTQPYLKLDTPVPAHPPTPPSALSGLSDREGARGSGEEYRPLSLLLCVDG